MLLIEPCCAERQMRLLRTVIGNSDTKEFEGYGDLSLTELLPAILTRYSETEMMIVAPAVPDQAAEIIEKWMRKQWARMDGIGKLDVIRHLTIVGDLRKKKSPTVWQWLKENPFGERLTLIDKPQTDTAILLPDFAITGPVNMRYGEQFVATATGNPETVKGLWEQYQELTMPDDDTAGHEEQGEESEIPESKETGEEPATNDD